MKIGSLFSGLGGIDLGFERAGFEITFQVEIDPYCQKVLRRHWPNVDLFGDIRDVDFTKCKRVQGLVGGFPCQDISNIGNGAGITGARSGLWTEYFRAIRTLRPQFALVENVPGLLVRGLDQVLCDLASIGYDAEWQIIPASAFGAPHKRERLFIVAYPASIRRNENFEVFQGSDLRNLFSRYSNWETTTRSARSISGRVFRVPEFEFLDVDHGLPKELDAIRGLGNAVVPQMAEFLANQIKGWLNR